MKKIFLFLIIILLFFLPSCAAIGMDNLPIGELIKTSVSPDGQYRVEAYLCSGNATTDNSLRCAVIETDSKKSRNIFWQYHQNKANIIWLDNNNIEINGIRLNVLTDSYDWREHKSIDDDLEYWETYWNLE